MDTRDLSLRSTSVHMVSSDSSLVELSSSRMLSASRSGSPVRRAVPEIGQVSTRLPSTRTNISGDAPINCSSPNCSRNSYGLGLAFLDALKQRRRAFGIVGLKGLPQDHFVVLALAHAFANGLHLGHVLVRLVIALDFVAGTLRAIGARAPSARRGPRWTRSPQREIVAKAFDLLLLAIHVVNVVAQKKLQVFALRGAEA